LTNDATLAVALAPQGALEGKRQLILQAFKVEEDVLDVSISRRASPLL
jgi:hypothetical protein